MDLGFSKLKETYPSQAASFQQSSSSKGVPIDVAIVAKTQLLDTTEIPTQSPASCIVSGKLLWGSTAPSLLSDSIQNSNSPCFHRRRVTWRTPTTDNCDTYKHASTSSQRVTPPLQG
ncbi:hypothetical protein SCLCIDRAFT_1209626 [Scleroderma citrinum Foug A]|uniref:Uncharacterized protein n=1 Tax=Scleroderma citrinum Foug A TaxID=1036808 RepID=A0A0C3EJ02_9AGAM|nr:hypothetical protein SCLCIDRAFT_1209626 [Scleroderma citrinum Foug A]